MFEENPDYFLEKVVEKVKACAQGAALATGARLETSFYELSYDDLITNEALSNVFTNNMIELGVDPNEIHEKGDGGSLDMGNVSQVCPSIHPYIKICDQPYVCHTIEFRDAAMTEPAFDGMILGAKTLAYTAYDVLTNTDLLNQIKAEFKAKK